MPEADSVWRTARRLHLACSNTIVRNAELRWPSLAGVDLTGWTTLEVVARGKHLLHRFDSGFTLHSHLRMEGRWEVSVGSGHRPPSSSDVRAWMSSEQWSARGRRLGMLNVVRTDRENRLVGHLGPDILNQDWAVGAMSSLLIRDSRAIGEVLLDQSVIAGLGTMWISEALFNRRLNPWVPGEHLDREVVQDLLGLLRRWLWLATEGSLLRGPGHGRQGAPGRVHGRSGRPCELCGGCVRVAMIGPVKQQRTMFYCPKCQGGYAPTDDRRPQRPLGSGYKGSRRR